MENQRSLGQTTLTLPFQLRGYAGRVVVNYAVNQDPRRWGFYLFDMTGAAGYPVCQATVEYEGAGYHAVVGWIQLVTIHETQDAHARTFVDTYPMFEPIDTPFAAFGYLPTLYDIPSPDPALRDQTWRAESFLVACPDVCFHRQIALITSFSWGYRIAQHVPTIEPVQPLERTRWDQHLTLLREHHPSWEFLSSIADAG